MAINVSKLNKKCSELFPLIVFPISLDC